MSLSTHVLDAAAGRPAAGVPVRLESRAPDRSWTPVAAGRTDEDGRIRDWPDPGAGVHRLVFETEGFSAFYPEVTVAFRITEPDGHHHIPLLLSPFAYSTYRGS
ncbi:hydroxyisourate hydrolase [Actinoallomurus rhizosphaericola]|uniref:hydroxyisourate hydrolase n=1 Tax=Actinoallomurus rhizosphaericola TaxID=2952536 RepID=UPI00209209CB|nr:hydroxyisourate hydrolase [Actinoallomurus rhizosphaericola]MCO5995332.1 hydroxyisourate hydrolase [Actinoallomurus rhizosphaericola]